MPAKQPRVRLLHILEEIDGMAAATQGLSVDQVLDGYATRRMVERALQIISEAAKELPAEVRALEPTVPWPNIISMGNYLRHEYHRIKPEVLTLILRDHLPALRPVVVRLLAHLPD
jgi:uncharacterized protein with HEPN domain